LDISQNRSQPGRHAAALEVALGVWLVLSGAAVTGLLVLSFLGIEMAAFRSAGGLLLVVLGLEMLQGREPDARGAERTPDDREDALWVPLVMPLLAGPGAIVTSITLAARETYSVWFIPLATIIAVTLASLFVFLVLTLAVFVSEHVRGRGTRILTRFSGLILVAIGFQMGFTGVAEFFGVGR
jgi:multiple antibiotic resistance protein